MNEGAEEEQVRTVSLHRLAPRGAGQEEEGEEGRQEAGERRRGHVWLEWAGSLAVVAGRAAGGHMRRRRWRRAGVGSD